MEVRPLAPGFGAQVPDIGIADVAARDDAYQAVRAAFEEQPGDVVTWNNRLTPHRGRSSPEGRPRHRVRTTISAADADGVADLRPSADTRQPRSTAARG